MPYVNESEYHEFMLWRVEKQDRMTNPLTTPSDPNGARKRISSYIEAYEDAPNWGGPTMYPAPPSIADLRTLLALRSPPSPGDEIQRLRDALQQAGHNLRAASKLYDCPGCKAGAVLAEAALSDGEVKA